MRYLILLVLSATLNAYDIVGLSSAFIDYTISIDSSDLDRITHERNNWKPISLDDFDSITRSYPYLISPGGSGANLLKGLSQLGLDVAMFGQVGDDDHAVYYEDEMLQIGVKTYLTRENLPTGKSICFITKDHQRTMRSYLGASHLSGKLKPDASLLKQTKWLHIEGYQLEDETLVLKTMKIAKENNVSISMDMSNPFIVQTHLTFLKMALPKYVDIIFCNQDEAFTFTGLKPEKAVEELANMCSIAAVTMGELGSFAQKGRERVFMPSFPKEAIDTTGAGDLFASGFLYGVIQNKSLADSAYIGTYLATQVIGQLSANIPKDIWKQIRMNLPHQLLALKKFPKSKLMPLLLDHEN